MTERRACWGVGRTFAMVLVVTAGFTSDVAIDDLLGRDQVEIPEDGKLLPTATLARLRLPSTPSSTSGRTVSKNRPTSLRKDSTSGEVMTGRYCVPVGWR